MNETMTDISIETHNASAPLEKIALETYVPPAKPSLVGLSRAEIAEQLGAIGVAPAQRKMRVQQLWHWIYVRGARNFDGRTRISPLPAPGWSPSRFPTTAPANGYYDCRAAMPSRRRMKSSVFTFPKPIAARCAFHRRSAAR